MDKMKQWIALTVVGALAILAGGWFLLVSPKRHDAADLKAQTASKQSSNQLLVTQLATLKAQAKDLPKQQAKLSAVAAKIPDNAAMPTLVRALSAAADDANVELVSVTPAAASAVAAGAATAGTATAAAPVAASATSGTLESINVSLSVAGSYFQVAQFLDRLESLSRAFRVTGLTIANGADPTKPTTVNQQAKVDSGAALLTSITGQVYLAPGRTTTPVTTTAK